ncbi:tRNA uridine-5-carboxymethylaminomethyl(34) synthesis GTPase MnmE [Sulfitobacter pontiacus]|uniref:tRNA uridine-5-carboxymethylaminomethyl(34) synthesis GTPase MnmE n=1 Tax=Sulfitobacter pontiacus TaxID=60137 RepID=UPI0021A7EEC0|nr:tRNA uridine-5-carboxymethylaminomethyl(34) synthesis GTPase MnmE [Sulfitobacter pontiacus]UWR19231.1 tRNA uridine-5-carboxymethylaminomethyl(34) synthesis GTPase MnmE [Sulfitobacter pontiacus]
MDTIFAQATAQGRAGVCVIRISGPQAFFIAETIAQPLPAPRVAAVRAISDADGQVIDRALVLTFEGPNSFTGEDTVELHLHGSIAVVRAVLQLLSGFDGTRLAEPGEFTRRAMENGKLDLTQVEGLGDLIEAETEAQRKQALRVLSGHLGQKVDIWREKLIRAAALLEVTIDFADEDVPVDVSPEVTELLNAVNADILAEIAGTHTAERIRTGFEVAIIGRPNAGKSTLLNALAGRDAAITSAVAGTTRDVIEVRMDLGGLPVTLLDTAGLREGADEVEAIGIDRAKTRGEQADLRVFLVEEGEELPVASTADDIVLRPKADLRDNADNAISGVTGQGVPQLIERIQAILGARSLNAGLATHERHRVALQKSAEGLAAALLVLDHGPDQYDIASEELRHSIRALEALVGRIDVENLLDVIFSSFCLGK